MQRLFRHPVRMLGDLLLIAVTTLALVFAYHEANTPTNLAYFDPNSPGPQPAAIGLLPGELVRGSGPPVYVIDDYHRKRHIADPQVFASCGWDVGRIRFVPDEALAVLESGPTITQC
jgi:hypothetical protein